jgi:hypothetical protein
MLFVLPGLVLIGALLFASAPDAISAVYKSIFYSGISPQKDMILRSHLGTITAGFWKTFLFLAVAAAAVWLYSRKKAGVAILWLIIAVALIDSYRFDLQFIKTYDQKAVFGSNPLTQYFQSLPGKFRVLDLAKRSLPTQNYLPMFGIEEMTSYNEPRWYQKLLGGMSMKNMANLNLWDMTNTRYLLLSPASPFKGEQLASAGFREVKRVQNFQIFENPSVLDRAYIVHQWVVEPDEDKRDALLLSSQFDPRLQVALATTPGISASTDSAVYFSDTVTIDTYENDRIALRTTSSAEGILVLSDNWYPAWKGYLDGNPVEVLRANSAFRGIVLPPGRHTVEFRYQSETYKTGRMLTLAGLLYVLAVTGWHLAPRRKTNAQ